MCYKDNIGKMDSFAVTFPTSSIAQVDVIKSMASERVEYFCIVVVPAATDNYSQVNSSKDLVQH